MWAPKSLARPFNETKDWRISFYYYSIDRRKSEQSLQSGQVREEGREREASQEAIFANFSPTENVEKCVRAKVPESFGAAAAKARSVPGM